MSRFLGRAFLGIIIILPVMGAMLYLEMRSATPTAAAGPKAIIDTVAVENHLLTLANAERQQFALEGKYLPFDQLCEKSGLKIAPNDRAPYVYSVEFNDSDFRVNATYNGPPDTGAPRTLSIDSSMQIQRE